MEVATLGNGCFWCTEAIFKELRGVLEVNPGYSGGFIENPTYEQVCGGESGHAEVIQITFDPEQITYEEILHAFFASHDPTTLNRQGNDVGSQYRSAIFYHNDVQKNTAEQVKTVMDASSEWQDSIVTEIVPLEIFYVADNYHQDYFQLNGNQPYCSYVIKPKVEKFRKRFGNMVK